MKTFSELRTDFTKDPELMSVLNGCSCVKDIQQGFAEKGYEVTEENIKEYCEEKLPMILEDCPELLQKLEEAAESEDLNGGMPNPLFTGIFSGAAGSGIGAMIAALAGGPVGLGAAAAVLVAGGIGAGAQAIHDHC